MRIQHNIMAMNAYRNYNNNTSALSKNLEKLSSGYKINRAGDDAAGLAISEKMRAQITGLDAATKNVKDGISLVKTAEGAMQEIHDMLNRMDYLATQSANGTYDNAVDRDNLQKEVDSLRTEINRIADASNFNGIKLLDGSLSANGASAGVPEIFGLDLTEVGATKAAPTVAFTAITGSLADKTKLTATVNYTDASGAAQSATLELTFDAAGKKLVTAGGKETTIVGTDAATANELAAAFAKAAAEDSGLSNTFKIDGSGATLNFTAKTAGANTAIKSVTQDWTATSFAQTAKTLATLGGTAGADAYQKIDMVHTAKNYAIGDVFTVGGEKFAFANNQEEAVKLGEQGVNAVVVATKDQVATGDVGNLAALIEQKTGYKPTVDTTTLQFKAPEGSTGKGGLNLQIGDTAEKFNQMTVSVGDMHAKALGIGGIDISSQDGASIAISAIKTAINTVSSTRGDLGAIQNRLEHTQNNLSVMKENIQDAESTIRDTDVADEMMAYTKNNILIQSAQAMLAQANQVPQGVLQLLQ